jgi:hypothetical protein
MGLKHIGLILSAVMILLAGCSLSPEEKVTRERALKQAIEGFVNSSVQSNWDELYRMSAGKFKDADQLKENLMMIRIPNATLTGGDIASMAWENEKMAIVKINWSFQAQSVQSLTSDTTIWVWKAKNWKYLGRSLR